MNFAFKLSYISLLLSLWSGFLNWVEWRVIWPAVVVFFVLSFLTWGFSVAEIPQREMPQVVVIKGKEEE